MLAEMRHQTGLSDCMYWIALHEAYGGNVRLVSVSGPAWSTLTCVQGPLWFPVLPADVKCHHINRT